MEIMIVMKVMHHPRSRHPIDGGGVRGVDLHLYMVVGADLHLSEGGEVSQGQTSN